MQHVYPGQNEKSVLYVSDLPPSTIVSDLWEFFKGFFDKIAAINLNQSGQHIYPNKKLNAKVVFKDFDSANKARLELNLRKLKGHAIRLMWDERDNSIRYNTNTNLFVKYIPFNITPREVYEFFSNFGDISSAKLNEDENGNHIGYGYVTYYSPESAQKAIAQCDGKEVWGNKLEVKHFQKMAERVSAFGPSDNKIFLTNFPQSLTENDIVTLCETYGEINLCTIKKDNFGRVNAIVGFYDAECAKKAQAGLDKQVISGFSLICELYKVKGGLKNLKGFQAPVKPIKEYEPKLNENDSWTSLFVKNIPFPAKDEELFNAFKKFGPITSAKIRRKSLVTKIKEEFKEIPTSLGIGSVCFENPEDAAKAKEELNGKFLPGYETWKNPLSIEYYMPRSQRNIMNVTPMSFQPPFQQQMPFNRPMFPPQMVPPPYTKAPEPVKIDPIDEKYFNGLETVESKKEYLGEIIFKQIEEHPLAQKNNMTIDTIGKITGMIINIDDINEIIETCRVESVLTSRINEALGLLNQK